MQTWYVKTLGDGMTGAGPADEIAAEFGRRYADSPAPGMAVFTRLESEGRLHCELLAYFPPAAAELAGHFEAEPCARPIRLGLGLLAGGPEAWSVWFGEE